MTQVPNRQICDVLIIGYRKSWDGSLYTVGDPNLSPVSSYLFLYHEIFSLSAMF